jgi:hypothetical protein
MTSMAIETPQLTLDALNGISQRISQNIGTFKDFENLDSFLSALNIGGFILKTMRGKGFNTYQDYINELLKPQERRDVISVSYVRGTCLAMIESLQKYLTQ